MYFCLSVFLAGFYCTAFAVFLGETLEDAEGVILYLHSIAITLYDEPNVFRYI